MPSSATITAFYTFSSNSKARASQVNNNFDVFRGHIIPVHPSTATSANNTYDIGSTEYRWRNGYLSNIFLGLTTTGWSISDLTTTGSDLVIRKNSVDRFRIASSSMSPTTTASLGQVATGTPLDVAGYTGTSEQVIAGSTLTISSMGKGVELRFTSRNDTATNLVIIGNNNTNTSNHSFRLYRESVRIGFVSIQTPLAPAGSAANFYMFPDAIKFLDYNPTTTAQRYWISYQGGAAADYVNVFRSVFLAYDI